jgi:hypothetical protein
MRGELKIRQGNLKERRGTERMKKELEMRQRN